MTFRRWQILLWLPVVTIDWQWFRPWWKPQRGIFPDCPEYGMPVTYDYWAWGLLEIRRLRK